MTKDGSHLSRSNSSIFAKKALKEFSFISNRDSHEITELRIAVLKLSCRFVRQLQ